MAQHIFQKQDVGLHAADVEFVQGALHLLDGVGEGVGLHYDLHEPGQGFSFRLTWHRFQGTGIDEVRIGFPLSCKGLATGLLRF